MLLQSRNRFFKFMIFLIAILLSFILVLVLISFFCFILFSKKKYKVEKGGNDVYRLTQFNTKSNKTSHGFIKLAKQLGEDEFDFKYLTKTESAVLVSNFGSKEYKCHGSCFCEEYERRGSSIALFKSGIIYLAAAMGLAVAFQHAQKHFEENCVKYLDDECPREAIRSEVNDCGDIDPVDLEEMMKDFEEEYALEEKMMTVKYLCQGNCMPNIYENADYIYSGDDYTVDSEWKGVFDECKSYGCEKRELKKEVYPWREDVNDYYDFSDESDVAKEEKIAEEFFKENLIDFCFETSMKEVVKWEGMCCDDYQGIDQKCDECCDNSCVEFVSKRDQINFKEDEPENCVSCMKYNHFVDKTTVPMCIGINGEEKNP